jgi:protein O-mannosyl-transferase
MPEPSESEYSFKKLLVPLTDIKAIHWIIFIGLVVYANMLFNGFVWDDLTYVVYNPGIHSLNILTLLQANSFNQEGQYRAFTAFYFSFLSLFSTSAFFYHSVQLVLHIINAILVYYIFCNFFKKNLSFFLSLIFLVHPVQVESVSFIAGADNILFFLFGSLALLLSFNKDKNIKRSFFIFGLLELSLLSKETGIGFVILILLLTVLFYKNKIRETLIFTACTLVVYAFIRFFIGGIYFNSSELRWIVPIDNLPFIERILNIPSIIFYYIYTFLFPRNLAIDQLWIIPSLSVRYFYLPLLFDLVFLFLLCFLGVYLFKKNSSLGKKYLFFVCWLLCGLGFYSQILPLDATVADRWMYFPIIGFLGIAGFFISEFKNIFGNKQIVPYLAIIIILLFSVRTIVRNTNFSDNYTLFLHDSKVADNFDIESNVGAILSSSRLFRAALPHTLKSVEMYPYDINLSNLGYIYEQLGNYNLAQKYYLDSISTQRVSTTHQNTVQYDYLRLSGLYLFHGKPGIAEDILMQATHKIPDSWNLWAFLALSEYYNNDKQKALAAAQNANKLYPNPSTSKLLYLISNNKPVNFQQL